MKICTVTKMPSLLDYIFCCLTCERPPKKYDSERANIGGRYFENDYEPT